MLLMPHRSGLARNLDTALDRFVAHGILREAKVALEVNRHGKMFNTLGF
jgi:hypothetical protein